MKILNILAGGGAGGLETLSNNIDKYSEVENYWVFLFSKGEIAEEMMTRHPNNVFYLGYNKINFVQFVVTINKVIKNNKIEIVNFNNSGLYCNLLFLNLKKLNPKVKFIKFLHSCYEDEVHLKNKLIRDKIYLFFLDKVLQSSDMIVSVSKAVEKTYCEKFNLVKKRKTVIYNGIDNKYFEKKPPIRQDISKRKLEIIYVGRLVKVKGVDILIKAINNIKKREFHLTIVGDGEEKDNLKKLVKELNMDEKVSFVGIQMNVIDWLDKSDVFVYPSIWKEAFGISVVESMARGCIPIVSNRGGLPEIIEDGKNGYIFEYKNELSLCEKIMYILNSKEKDNIIKNAIETSKKFSIRNTIQNLNKMYNELLNK